MEILYHHNSRNHHVCTYKTLHFTHLDKYSININGQTFASFTVICIEPLMSTIKPVTGTNKTCNLEVTLNYNKVKK